MSIEHPLDLVPAVAAEHAKRAAAAKESPFRKLLCVGMSGSGKTYSNVTTAKNPIVVDYDHQLNDRAVLDKLVGVFPMYDKEFIHKEFGLLPTRMDAQKIAVKTLFQKHLSKLSPECTVIWDSGTLMADFIEEILWEQTPTSKGEKDGYEFWDMWADWWREFCADVRDLRCNFVLTFHEKEQYDKKGNFLGWSWALAGKKFASRFSQFFTDCVRQVRQSAPANGVANVKYLWQVAPTDDFVWAKTRLKTDKLYIPASWNELLK